MIDELTPYPEYGVSGLPWLGKVPAHSQVRRIKTVLREIDRRSEAGREPLLSLRLHGGLVDHHALGGKTIPPSALVGYKHIKPGEIVMNRMRAALGLFAAAETEGLVSPDYAIFHPVRAVNLDYAVQLFRTPAMASVFRLESRGLGTGESGFLRLYSDRFGTIPIPFPPLDEQVAIVRFLGWENRRFDHIIRGKRKKLQLVQEMLQVELEHALQSKEIKRSRLTNVAEVINRPIDRIADKSFTRIGLYNRGRGLFHKMPADGQDLGDSDFFYVHEGDFIASGQFAWEGAVALAHAEDAGCIVSHRYLILRGRDGEVSSPYLYAFFRSSYGAMLLDLHSRGAAGRNRPLNTARFMKQELLYPSMPAHERIAAMLERERAVAQSLNKAVAALNEYRNRLSTDAVLGRMDVRVIASRLPVKDVIETLDGADDDADADIYLEAAEEDEAA